MRKKILIAGAIACIAILSVVLIHWQAKPVQSRRDRVPSPSQPVLPKAIPSGDGHTDPASGKEPLTPEQIDALLCQSYHMWQDRDAFPSDIPSSSRPPSARRLEERQRLSDYLRNRLVVGLINKGVPEEFCTPEGVRAGTLRHFARELTAAASHEERLKIAEALADSRDREALADAWFELSEQIFRVFHRVRSNDLEQAFVQSAFNDNREYAQHLLDELKALPAEDAESQVPLALRILISPHNADDVYDLLEWLDEMAPSGETRILAELFRDPLLNPDTVLASKGYARHEDVLYPLLVKYGMYAHYGTSDSGATKTILDCAPSPEILADAIRELGESCTSFYYAPISSLALDPDQPMIVRETATQIFTRYVRVGASRVSDVMRLPPDETSAKLKLIVIDEAEKLAPETTAAIRRRDVERILTNPNEPESLRQAVKRFWENCGDNYPRTWVDKSPIERQLERMAEAENDLKREKLRYQKFREQLSENGKTYPVSFSELASIFVRENDILEAQMEFIRLKLVEYEEKNNKPAPTLNDLDLPADIDLDQFYYYPAENAKETRGIITLIAKKFRKFGNGNQICVKEEYRPSVLIELSTYLRLIEEKGKENVPQPVRYMNRYAPRLYAVYRKSVVELQKSTYEHYFYRDWENRERAGLSQLPLDEIEEEFARLPDDSVWGPLPETPYGERGLRRPASYRRGD